MKLKDTLRRLLKDNKMTVAVLAQETGVNENTIKTWLGGANPRNLDHVRKISRRFNVGVEYLLFGDEDLPAKTLEELITENVYEGWLKVKIERAIRTK